MMIIYSERAKYVFEHQRSDTEVSIHINPHRQLQLVRSETKKTVKFFIKSHLFLVVNGVVYGAEKEFNQAFSLPTVLV